VAGLCVLCIFVWESVIFVCFLNIIKKGWRDFVYFVCFVVKYFFSLRSLCLCVRKSPLITAESNPANRRPPGVSNLLSESDGSRRIIPPSQHVRQLLLL
jgi:hypothetical protein